MLAQNFLSSADLGVTDEEHAALVHVLGMLEREELPHIPIRDVYAESWQGDGFQMNRYLQQRDCGTAGCIAGWVSLTLGTGYLGARAFSKKTFQLNNLCHAPEIAETDDDLNTITPAQAAMALRSYLSTGEANWREALT